MDARTLLGLAAFLHCCAGRRTDFTLNAAATAQIAGKTRRQCRCQALQVVSHTCTQRSRFPSSSMTSIPSLPSLKPPFPFPFCSPVSTQHKHRTCSQRGYGFDDYSSSRKKSKRRKKEKKQNPASKMLEPAIYMFQDERVWTEKQEQRPSSRTLKTCCGGPPASHLVLPAMRLLKRREGSADGVWGATFI
ncbi:hypothetical protein IWX90DRAFT_442283 [Phyllosticta citrichinensis]|uniref:Uncharacterized protein n=1 Tax=Phyllosticta citrichinensis TaxID=1130410 RepID=A0ABR1XJM0_9PEZI